MNKLVLAISVIATCCAITFERSFAAELVKVQCTEFAFASWTSADGPGPHKLGTNSDPINVIPGASQAYTIDIQDRVVSGSYPGMPTPSEHYKLDSVTDDVYLFSTPIPSIHADGVGKISVRINRYNGAYVKMDEAFDGNNEVRATIIGYGVCGIAKVKF